MQDNKEELFKQNFTHMADQLEPSREAEARIWEELQGAPASKKVSHISAASIVIAVMLLAAGGMLSVNAATGGRFFDSIAEASEMDISLFEKIKHVCSSKEHQKRVAKETVKIPNEVYAPKLVACSDNYIVWANERGLMVYDRSTDKLASTLDLQELKCNYLNADTIETCIFMEDDTLYIFNRKKVSKQNADEDDNIDTVELAAQQAFTYKLSEAEGENALDMITDTEKLASIKSAWLNYHQSYIKDTFDEMQGSVIDLNELSGHDETTYSENCILWNNEAGAKAESFLVVMTDGRYVLYTRNMKDNSLNEQELSVVTETAEETSQDATSALPAFEYSGDDEIIRALCDEAMKEENSYLRSTGSVFIPAPYVHKTVTDGADIVVFCELSTSSFYQNGNTLNSESGGVVPCRIKLTPDGAGGYKVTEHLEAEDGEEYWKSIEAFCAEYGVSPEIYNEEFDGEANRKKFIKMYVTDNQLDIKYYKDYGWDPVPLDSGN